ncbi:MAG TPA: glycosyltransferase family 2 protein [bacterium]|nr:glycosyltransferase family 2 protein [bacterium]
MAAASAKPDLSIIVPVYNEREAVGGVLDSIRDAGISASYEIVAVDDGSTDGSAEILEKLAAAGRIRVARHGRNVGYGAALKTGISAARGELVMIIDGDGSYPVKHFDEFVGEARDHDMVVGARVTAVLQEPKIRTLVKRFIIRMLKVLADIDVPDLNSGLRLMRREQVMRYFHLLPDGISFTSTITLILLSENRPVKFVPIDYFARTGASKFKPLRDTLGILLLILRTFLYFNPLKVFVPAAAALMALALIIGAGSALAGRFMDVTTVVVFLTAVQVFVLGLVADLIAKRRQ